MNMYKFRAWDKLNKKMYPNPFNGKIGGINDIFSNSGNWIYMQSSSLKDQDGVEIYEDDVVAKFDFENVYFRSVVVRSLAAFGYVAFGDFIPFAANYHFNWTKGQSDKIKVIGNIYESPGLAKQICDVK